MADLVGLIPAAGRGVRAYPYTDTIPKSMLEVDGVPVIQRNVELLRDQLAIRDIHIVVGHQGHVIRSHLGDGARFGVRIAYVTNDRLDLELPYSVYLGGREIDRPCCMILADECYVNANHRDLRAHLDRPALVTCGLIRADYAKHVRKNYTATLVDGRIVDLHEKPTRVSGPLMGTGTYLLAPEVFRRLEAAFVEVKTFPRDWTTWLAALCRSGELVLPFHLTGSYVNINSRDDLNYANYLVRELTFEHKRTSLIYVIDREEEAAARPVEGFAARPEIHEVIAVARRSAPALEAAARNPKVRLLLAAPDAPPAHLFTRGMDEARGDILLLSYSDDTFSPRDVTKLLVYLRDADLVVGTRTTRQMIEQGTNMRGVVRAAHLILAKLLEALWWRFDCRFTDVCCIYRALWRSTYTTIRSNLRARGVELFPEMVIEVLRARRRIVEIPVNYYNHDLEYDYVRSRYQTFETFRRIVWLMLRKRFQRPRR